MKTKKIPIVAYKGGKRTIIGEALVKDDGRDLHIHAEIDPVYNRLICAPDNHISIGYGNSEES
jgi:hypothetical protein